MTKSLLFDFSKVLLFAKDTNYTGDVNPKHDGHSSQIGFQFLSSEQILPELKHRVHHQH